MDDFSSHLKAVQKGTLFFLAFCFFGWALFPGVRHEFAGLILGVLVSFISSQYLAWKIRQITEVALSKSKQRVNTGFMTRASLALLAVIIAYRLEWVAMSTTIAGLFFTQILAFLIGVFSLRKKRK